MTEIVQPERVSSGATIYDVAARAGVSIATVSRMINKSGYVSQASRSRIQSAMEALHYEPNGLARSLITKQTEMLALLLSDVMNPFSAQIARGVQDIAQAANYIPIICNVDDPAMELKTVRALSRKRIDGLILTSTAGEGVAENERVLHDLCERGLAMVCIGRRPVHPHADEVSTDTFGGARCATVYLATLGHRQIAFIGGQFTRGIALGRLRGYRAGLAEAGLPAAVQFVREGHLDEASGYEQTLALMALATPPTAIFCVNDLTAMGALRALHTLGRAVPQEVSIVGYDDIPLAGLVDPPLTTIGQPARELGDLAATFLLERITHPDGPHQRRDLPFQLIVRGSSGAPADQGR